MKGFFMKLALLSDTHYGNNAHGPGGRPFSKKDHKELAAPARTRVRDANVAVWVQVERQVWDHTWAQMWELSDRTFPYNPSEKEAIMPKAKQDVVTHYVLLCLLVVGFVVFLVGIERNRDAIDRKSEQMRQMEEQVQKTRDQLNKIMERR